jgi:hypothetical protein
MKFWNTLKSVNSNSLMQLIVLALKNPLFLYPTFLATVTCMRIATLHYGREHYKNRPANAFRHAFWNYLIAHNCSKWSSSQSKTLQWTKTITDWHENAFPNRELPRAMDFHNNEIGRNIYITNSSQPLEIAILLLLNRTQNAIQIRNIKDVSKVTDLLVYIAPSAKVIA